METVAETFRYVQEQWDAHKDSHDNPSECPLMAEDAFPLSDEIRAELLGLVMEAHRRQLITDEDELDLEVAIGTYGDPAHYGWPDTTTGPQKFGIVLFIGRLMHTMANTADIMDSLGGAIAELRKNGYEAPEGAVEVKVFDEEGHEVPDKVLPPALRKLLGSARNSGSEAPSDDDSDWFRRGYL